MLKLQMTIIDSEGNTRPTEEHTLRGLTHLDKISIPGFGNYEKIQLKRHKQVEFDSIDGTEVELKLLEVN